MDARPGPDEAEALVPRLELALADATIRPTSSCLCEP